MFSPEVVKARLNEKPFRPLRIIASEGLTYDIAHPDLVWVGWNDLQIGFANRDVACCRLGALTRAHANVVEQERIRVRLAASLLTGCLL